MASVQAQCYLLLNPIHEQPKVWLCKSTIADRHVVSTNAGHINIPSGTSRSSEKSHKSLSTESCAFESLVAAVRQCGQNKSLVSGKQVHHRITESAYGDNVFLGNCLVEMYAECGSLVDAQHAFDQIPWPNICSWNLLLKVYAHNGRLEDAKRTFSKMPKRDVISWSTMIAALVRHKEAMEAFHLYDRMEWDEVEPNAITFLSVLDACSSMSNVSKGRTIHAAIIEFGYCGDMVVDTALVNMYGKCGDFLGAQQAFHCMQQRDVVAWNAMINVSSENHENRIAICFYDEMGLHALLPTKVTYLCVLDACNDPAFLEKGREIHMAAIMHGFDLEVAVGTALTHMYGRCGSLTCARAVFVHISQRNTLSWNVILAACTENGDGKEALMFFQQMQFDGIKPDKYTFASLLDACSASSLLEEGKQIHAMLHDCMLDQDEAVGNALINMYGKCGSLVEARDVFDTLRCKNIISWTAMMSAYAENGHGNEALDLFEKMKSAGVEQDMVTFLVALEACIHVSALKIGVEIHVDLVGIGYEWNLVLSTALINMYAKCGSLDDAQRIFCRMPEHDVVCWNIIVAACAQNGYYKETLEFFEQMQVIGVKPDKITFFYVISACIHTGKIDAGRQQFFSMVQKYGLDHMGEHYVAMVDLLCRAGHLGEAEALITSLPVDLVEVALSSFLAACNVHGDQGMAMDAGENILRLGSIDPSPFVTLSNAYAISGGV